jgi:hypothetical protein
MITLSTRGHPIARNLLPRSDLECTPREELGGEARKELLKDPTAGNQHHVRKPSLGSHTAALAQAPLHDDDPRARFATVAAAANPAMLPPTTTARSIESMAPPRPVLAPPSVATLRLPTTPGPR